MVGMNGGNLRNRQQTTPIEKFESCSLLSTAFFLPFAEARFGVCSGLNPMSTPTVTFWDEVHTPLSTPEQVDLHLAVANVGSRGLALMIDLAIRYGAFWLLFFGVTTGVRLGWFDLGLSLDVKGFALLLLFVVFISEWLYFTFFEWLWNGQTPGKRLMGLRVIKVDGSPIGWLEAVLRNFTRPIDSAGPMALVGIAFIFFQPRSQRPGDLAARTLVIREVPIDWKSFFPEASPSVVAEEPARTKVPLAPLEVELLQQYRQRAALLSAARCDELSALIRAKLQPRARGTDLEASLLNDHEWLEALARRL